MSRPGISPQRYSERIQRAQQQLPAEDASALLIGVGAELEWLIGYSALPLERLTMLVVPAQGRATLVVPRLEVAAAQASPAVGAGVVELAAWAETDDPFALVNRLLQDSKARPEIQLGALGGAWGRLGGLLVSDQLWATFLFSLQVAVPEADFGLASSLLGPLRAIKDDEEISLLRQAAHAADRVVQQIAAGRLCGRSERDLAREVRQRLADEGHDGDVFAIVGSGPNTASPHHEPSDRSVEAGEPLLFDIGGRLSGYASDTTRTLWVAGPQGIGPSDEFRRLHGIVQEAQAAATRAVQPGVACETIDAAARQLIAESGYGDNFIHRTGHGIGLQVHEPPYLVDGNEEPLRPGHAFSIEPGIYLDGRHGARIEDIVVCTTDGADVLNQSSRELLVVAG